MKESEKYATLKNDSRFFIVVGLIISAPAIASIIYMAVSIQYIALCILGILALLFLCPYMIDHVGKYRRAKKMEVLWKQAESGENSQLQKKCQIYEAALENVEGYKKDVARMEERARSIKAEIEAEMKNRRGK